MQMDEASERRKEWGDKPCDHPQVVKEYFLGTNTGTSYVRNAGSRHHLVNISRRSNRNKGFAA